MPVFRHGTPLPGMIPSNQICRRNGNGEGDLDVPSLVATLASPPASYRPAPFFVLNDDHEGPAGEARITKILEDYARIGFGGAFLHPRPGLITEYLSPRWFEL